MLTPYPGTLTWYEMKKKGQILTYDWEKFDQANVVYTPEQMTPGRAAHRPYRGLQEILLGGLAGPALPADGASRSRAQWAIYNLFMKKGSATGRKDRVPEPTAEPDIAPVPPILPIKREWKAAVLEAIGDRKAPQTERERAPKLRA